MLGSELVGSSMFDGVGSESSPPESGVNAPEGPNRDNETPEQVARRNGIDATSVEEISRTSEITSDKTIYVAHGRLEWDGRVEGEFHDTAVVGRQDAYIELPEEFRIPAVDVSGDSFVWSGIDADQSARNAWFRFYSRGKNMTLEDGRTIGSGGRANPSDGREYSVRNGAAYYMPAPGGATNTIRNFVDIHGGELPRKHWGNRPMGIWLGPRHEGTLKVLDAHIEEYGNNGVYATNVPGRVEVEHSRFWNNGVNQIRIAHGHVEDCSVGFDYENTGLSFANQAEHASNGISAEQKKSGANGASGPDVRRTAIEMKNVGRGGHGLRAYRIYTPADFGVIEDVEIHIGKEDTGIAADMAINGDVEAIRGCVLSGTADRFVSVLNNSDSRVVMGGCEWDYPAGRARDRGDVAWR